MSKPTSTLHSERRRAAHIGALAFAVSSALAGCGVDDATTGPPTVPTTGPETTVAKFALETCPDVPWLHEPAVAADALPQPPPESVLKQLMAIVEADPNGAGLYVGEHQDIVVNFSEADAQRDAELVEIGGRWPVSVRTVSYTDDEVLADSTPLNNTLQALGESGIGSAWYSPILNRAVVVRLEPSRVSETL